MKHVIALTILLYIGALTPSLAQAANPASTNYAIQSYSVGSGGLGTGSSASYKLNGILGPLSGNTSSTSYASKNGLSFLQTVSVPPAPTLTNPNNYYNKLSLTLATGGNPTDTMYAIAISPDNFSTTKYVQSDDTLGSSPVWQTNTLWGASGFTLIGLTPGTTYSVKVTAKQGNFSQSPFGPVATAATVTPSFTFSLSTNAVGLGQLTPGTVITAPTTVTTTVSTNTNAGAQVVIYDKNNGLLSSGTNYTINSVSNNLATTTEGYGVRGKTVTQTSGGPLEILSPFNGSGNIVGQVATTKQVLFDSSGAAITNGQGTFEIQAKAGSGAKAATDYSDILTVVASGVF